MISRTRMVACVTVAAWLPAAVAPTLAASAAVAAPARAAATSGPGTTVPVADTPDVVPVIAVDPHRTSTTAARVVVRGAATPGAVLAMDGRPVGVVDSTGRWRVRLRLHNGVNSVTFGIADRAGYATASYSIRHAQPFSVTKTGLPDGTTQVTISCHQPVHPCAVTLQLIGYGDKAHAKTEKALKQKSISVPARKTDTLRLLNIGGRIYVLALKGNPASAHLLDTPAGPAKKKKLKRGTPAALNVVATSELSTESTGSSSGADDDPTTGSASAPPSSAPAPASTDPTAATVIASAPVLISGMFTITDTPTAPAPAVVVPVDPDSPIMSEPQTTILGYYVDDRTVYETDDVTTTYTYPDGDVIVQDRIVSVADGTYPPGTDLPIVADFMTVTVPVAVSPPPATSCAYDIGKYTGANSLLGAGPCS